jgi:hypothetical protein
LPIRLVLRQLHFAADKAHVELELTNSSSHNFAVPSCLDAAKAFAPGAVDRRSMEFGLSLRSSSGVTSELIEVTFGSSSRACMTYVEPGHTLDIIMEAQTPSPILDAMRQTSRAPVSVFASEVTFEDQRYFIRDRSTRVESQSKDVEFR